MTIATYPCSKLVEYDWDWAEGKGHQTQHCARPIYAHLRTPVSSLPGKVTFGRTPSNITVVNRGNAAPKPQRNTVLTEKADAVYILAEC